ncbi:Activating transcription factor 7-interacting protein 1 ATF-interacting protein [Collichthys lucidus]|uniref:Activating transcription factor 7-interacting protein 1 ATF-interacting protein n=1 Tax=Collichthys lucidus TaxID=240159 RepID=A0A4U5VUQ6_COLLU|nr:Activating transcription factor 7-interacting protein 1 ATF-interacting protein [Collichthys lucidus]
MKRVLPTSASSRASDKRIKFSQSEVQMLIKQEVLSAVRQRENKMQGLLEAIQQLDHESDYEIQKLEARINTVTKRAEAALACMTETKKKRPPPSPISVDTTGSDSEDETMETVSQNKELMKRMDTSGKANNLVGARDLSLVLSVQETTRKTLQMTKDDNKEDLGEVLQSPPTPTDTSDPPDAQEKENVEDRTQDEEPKAKRVKTESISPGHSSSPKHPEAKQPSCPRLPPTPFPSNLSMEAASYNIPQRPEVQLALIKNPRSLSVLWTLEGDDPCAPPMDSYSILLTMEKVKGSSIFPKWNTLDEVKAIPLPMCVMITKFKAGHKVCVAVVGKDKFGRYGPYSKVVTAAIPE